MSVLNYIAPFVGAALLEVVQWYRLREKLDNERYRRLLRSPGYWVITVLTGVLGAIAALIYFATRSELSPAELLVAGAAFPTLFKKLVAAFVDKEVTTLGDLSEKRKSTISTYLSVS